jgi:hypothetical protein
MNKLARFYLLALSIIVSHLSNATTYYVSYANGNDTYSGTALAAPYKTITKAVSVAVAGDIIYLRGEVHYYSAKINLSKVGTAAAKFYLLAYPGDATRPVLNFSAMTVSTSNRGLDLSGNYWVLKGFDVYKAGDNGMHVNGSNNIIEFCAFYENADTGLQFDNGASNNQIINCDSYFNIDPSEGNADGFAVKLNVGTGNAFKGCRSWQNSDDGWDGLLSTGVGTNPSTTYDSCWCFLNGYRKDMTASLGNGNGFKMGGNQEQHDATLRNCLSVYNRVKGFDQNNDVGSMTLYNCTGYKNSPNFGMNNYDPAPGKVMVVKNCISYLGRSTDAFRAVVTRTNNSWQSPFVVTNADFVSLDTSVFRSPRNADGSLPDISFMKLAQGSDLIDGGTNVGLPYYGAAPDLGYAESNYPLPVEMLSFTAVAREKSVELKWSTSTELNNTGWDVERYVPNTVAWQKIGFVNGKLNSTTVNNYSFADNNVPGTTIQYRLKQIDKDGHYRYSNIITVHLGAAGTKLAVYPNPVKNTATISFDLQRSGSIDLSIYSQNGQLVEQLTHGSFQAGRQFISLHDAKMAAGQYCLRLSTADGVYSSPFIKL